MIEKRHYCSGCKRLVPLAPGTYGDSFSTIGVAHAYVPYQRGSACGWYSSRRLYHQDEQAEHFEQLMADVEGWDAADLQS